MPLDQSPCTHSTRRPVPDPSLALYPTLAWPIISASSSLHHRSRLSGYGLLRYLSILDVRFKASGADSGAAFGSKEHTCLNRRTQYTGQVGSPVCVVSTSNQLL
jgi:hypothetical protein